MKANYKNRLPNICAELSLYPHRSKAENVIRGLIWMASWLVGIVAQNSDNSKIIGGAYLIFALSLLLEFIPETRCEVIPKIIHGFFCTMLIIMLLGAIIQSFDEHISNKSNIITSLWIYRYISECPTKIGWIVFVMIFLGIILSVFEISTIIPTTKESFPDDTESKLAIFEEKLKTPISTQCGMKGE